MTVLLLLVLLQGKHYVADFHLQSEWMIRDKARYGGRGGLAHAGFHGLLTLPVLVAGAVPLAAALALALAETAIHYHIDWIKARAGRGLTPDRQAYWRHLGLDQMAHQLTYIGLLAVVVAI